MHQMPGQFSFRELMDMPEHMRFVLYALAVRLQAHSMKATLDAKATGECKPIYEDL